MVIRYKRILCALLAALLLLSACSSDTDPTETQTGPIQTAEQTTTAPRATVPPQTDPTVPTTTEEPIPDYPFEPTSTGIYVTRSGEISSAEITSFDNGAFLEPRYDVEELKKFVEQEVDNFNLAQKAPAVAINTLTVEKGVAKLIMSYGSFSYFLEFQGADFGVKYLALTDRDSAIQNYDIQDLMDPEGHPVDLVAALTGDDLNVLVISGKTMVTINGDIRYLSAGMVVTGVNSARCDDDRQYSFIIFR